MKIQIGSMHCWPKGESSVICQHWQTEIASGLGILAFYNSFICQPQQRHIHGHIFGGFFMRRAFELAFSTTYAFAGVQPHFLEVDHVDFFKPVSIDHTLY